MSFEKNLFGLYSVRILYATVDWTYRSTLRLFMKTLAFGTLVWNYEIVVIFHRLIVGIGINHFAGFQGEHTFIRRSLGDLPVNPSFINSIVGALRFTSPTVDAFVSYDNGHFLLFCL